MKKLFILAIMGVLCVMSSMAQSDESPLPLTPGINRYEVPDYEPWVSYVVYSYTNAETQGELLTLKGETIYSVSAMSGDEWVYSATGFNQNEHIFAVKAGETLKLTIYPTFSSLEFDATVKSGVALTGGESEENALPLTIGESYVPWFFNSETFMTSPTYLAYEAEREGIYQLRIPTTATLGYRKGNAGEFTTLSPKIDDSYVSTYKLPFSEAGRYMIEVTPTSAFIGELSYLGNGEEGSMPETAIEAQGTDNLPAAAGEWWWKFTPEESGFAVIESNTKLGDDGFARLYDDISGTDAIQGANGAIAIRQRVTAGKTYYICIKKGETTPEDIFTISIEPEQAGDTENNPIIITESGQYTTSKFNGTYHYSISVPQEEDGKYLYVKTDSKFNSTETYATLRSGSQAASMVNGHMRVTVSGGENCAMMWTLDEGINDIEFTVGYEEKTAGDEVDSAIEAKEGMNALAAGPEKYYTFNPTMREFIGIKTANPDIHFDICTRSGNWLVQLNKFHDNDWTKARIADLRDDIIYIVFDNIKEATEFELKEIPFETGDVFEFPAKAELGENALPECDEHYYEFTAEETGWLVINKPEMVLVTLYYMMYPSDGSDPYYTNSMEGIVTQGGVKYGVKAGEKYILGFSYVDQPSTFTLLSEPMLPGQGRETAVEIKDGTIELPTDTDYMWYKYDVDACGYLNISSDIEYGDDYSGGVWKTSTLEAYPTGKDEVNYLYDYQTDEFKGSLTVRPGDSYLIKVASVANFNGNTLTVEMEDPEALNEGSNIMPEISAWYGYRWYVAEVPGPGNVTVKSDGWSFDMELYLPEDFKNPVAEAQTMQDGTSELTYKTESAGPLFFLATYVFGGTDIIYTFIPGSGVDKISKDTIDCHVVDESLVITAPGSVATIFTLDGKAIETRYVDGTEDIKLPKGCYVVKIADKTYKVMI